MSHGNLNEDGILLIGADAITQYLFGHPRYRRRVYHLVERGELPIFNLGGKLAARPEALTRAIEKREAGVA